MKRMVKADPNQAL